MQETLTDKKQSRIYFAIGGICFLLLMILAVIYFKERTAFCDTAFQLVYLLVKQKTIVMPVRMGAAISQLIPLAAIGLHGDLRTVMVVHSLSTLLLYLALFLGAYSMSKKTFLFLMILLSLTLIANEVFYWTVSDVQLGLIWLSFYSVFLFEDIGRDRLWAWPIHFAFILWIQIFHLLLFLPILFLVFYYYDSRSKLFSKQFLIHFTICLLSFFIRYRVAQGNWYERQKINIWSSMQDQLPHLFWLDSAHMLFNKMSVYWIYFLTLAISIGWLAYAKKYLASFTVAAVSVGHWLLVVVTDPNDSGFYLENMLLPLGFIAALPIVADILPLYRSKWITTLVLLLLLIRISTIYEAHTKYTERLALYQPYIKYVQEKKINGVFVNDLQIDRKKYFMLWGSGYESMLLSSLASPDSCAIVQFDDGLSPKTAMMHSDTIPIMPLKVWGQVTLPERYFRLKGSDYDIYRK